MIRFNEVALRAERDPDYFERLRETAQRAERDGFGSKAWRELARHFVDEDEIHLLSPPPNKKFRPGQFEPALLSLTLLEVLHWVSGASHGTTMSTTTTTSMLCTLPGTHSHRRPRKGGAKQAAKKSAAKKSRAAKKG